MKSALQAVRAGLRVLYAPDRFFAAPKHRTVTRALGVVTIIALVTTIGIAGIGWGFATNVDATTTVTTMEPWPDSTCESFAAMNGSSNVSSVPEPCQIDEPRTRTVSIGDEIWKAFRGQLPAVFLGTFLAWLVIGVVLHVLTAFVDGTGSFAATLAVAGWGLLPSVFGTLAGLVIVVMTFQGMEFASDPEVLREQFETLAATDRGPLQLVVSIVVTLWQGYIWAYGLKHARNLPLDRAAIAAGIATVIALLLEFVG